MEIVYHPIGYIRSPFTDTAGMPIQPAGASGVEGRIEVLPEYEEGLKDLSGFSHVIVLCHFHKARGFELSVVPFLDSAARGLFATRAPRRPNPIGFSVFGISRIDGPTVYVKNVDMLDGTPILDLKPYVPDFVEADEIRLGWLEAHRGEVVRKVSDDRFK
ncbi:MAG: tRNA (N6-threonylcarbamoyladenosine(37)-N6)-methyltransferase TrmO [Acidobacteriota bacterium]